MKYSKELSQIAKSSTELYIRENKILRLNQLPETISGNTELLMKLNLKKSCFVTLSKNSELRGCIGTIEPSVTLFEEIIENSISAATRDYRFPSVKEDELNLLEYEVSVLTTPQDLIYANIQNLQEEIKNRGVILSLKNNKAVYLPQVWEQFNTSEDFLTSLCLKAGLLGSIWKSKKVKIQIFDKE